MLVPVAGRAERVDAEVAVYRGRCALVNDQTARCNLLIYRDAYEQDTEFTLYLVRYLYRVSQFAQYLDTAATISTYAGLRQLSRGPGSDGRDSLHGLV